MATPFNQELEARVDRYLSGEDSAATLWSWLIRYVLVPGAHRRDLQVREAAGPVIHALAELQGNHRSELDVKNELRELRFRGRNVRTARGGTAVPATFITS